MNLSNGSISCVCFGEKHYLLSLNGVLAIKGENRYFTQSFILEKLKDTPRVFYIRADTLSLLAPQSLSDKNGIEFSADLAQEASSAPSEREPRRVSDHSKNQERKKFVHRDNHRDDRDDSRPRENSSRPLFEIIFVKNIPDDCTESSLIEAFKEFGEINQIKIFDGKKYATVSFNKQNRDFNSHEVYDKIEASKKEILVCGKSVRIEPFNLNHKKLNYDRYHGGNSREYARQEK